MKASAFILLAVSGIFVRALSIKRDYNEDEHLVLSDCGIGTDGLSKSRQMMYYKGNPWNGKNIWIRPDMMAEVPWDGSYPWRTTGVSSRMSNGDIFTVKIDPAIPDYDANNTRLAGQASHTYDEHNLDCYASHQSDVYTLDDGTKCSSAYICNHYMAEEPPKSIRRTKVSFSSMDVDVSDSTTANKDGFDLVDPYDAYHKIFDDIHDSQCDSIPYPIGGGCSIKFTCTFLDPQGYPANASAEAMGRLFPESAGREISKNVTNWTTYTNTGRVSVAVRHRKFTYPQNGQIVVSTELEGNPDSVAMQSSLRYDIECEKSSFCGKTCQIIASTALAIGSSPAFAPANLFGIFLGGGCTQCA